MCELCQLDAILLAQQVLLVYTLLDAINLNCLVALGGHEKLARIIEVERQHVWLRTAILDVLPLEKLRTSQLESSQYGFWALLAFVGRNDDMASLNGVVLLVARDRVMLSEFPLAGVDSRWSKSIGVEAMMGSFGIPRALLADASIGAVASREQTLFSSQEEI